MDESGKRTAFICYAYDRNGQLSKVIRPNEYQAHGDAGAGVVYTYDEEGRILTVIRPDGVIAESNTYDEEGQLIRTTDAAGSGAGFTYDFGGRRTRVRTTGQASQEYEYDALGNIIGIKDGEGNRTGYALDAWGRITEIEKADGSSEYYGYDYAGNIIRSVDGEGNTTEYEYNGINRIASVTDPLGGKETYAYDLEERLCRKTDRNGTESRYTYNLYGNLLLKRAGELSEAYEYTPEGLLRSAVSGGMRYNYAYDVMGRLTGKSASGRKLLALDYDLNGNMIRQTDVTGKVTEYRYDLMDQLLQVLDDGKSMAEYAYYPDGLVKSLKNGESLYTEYAYDNDKNLSFLKTRLGSETLAENHYRYDGNGSRTEKRQMNGTTLYHYDSQNRLRMAEYPGRTEELFYDKAGNRTRRLVNGREELYRYDKRNRLTEHIMDGETERFAYDGAGNLVEDGRARYEYNAFNRVTKTETFNGNIQINRYDPEGLRHEMEENGELVRFIFRDREVIAEEKEKGDIRYIRGQDLLASDAEHARTYYHYASDEMGSITHVTAREEVLNRYEYDAWGNVLTCEEQVENRFRFAGEQYDPISQQYYLRARFYNPVIGRFTQEDSYRGDGLNLYAYCQNNPVYYVDPTGHICEGVARQIIDKLNENQAGGNERKKLAKYLRDKVDHGEKLSPTESDAAKRLGLNLKRVVSAEEYTGKTRGKISVEGTYTSSDKASDILRGELHAAGVPSVTPYENDAHHMVPIGMEKAEKALNILMDYGIDPNSAANGVFLPARKNGYEGDAVPHRGGHSEDYINKINNRIIAAAKQASKEAPNDKIKGASIIEKELSSIRSDLLTGKLKIFSGGKNENL